jgi:hypothetical protein
MSYRRTRDLTPGSSALRLRHRQPLLECGVPDTVLGSDRSLAYVLLHGDDEPRSRWSCSQLGGRQAVALLRFLEAQLVPANCYEILGHCGAGALPRNRFRVAARRAAARYAQQVTPSD